MLDGELNLSDSVPSVSILGLTIDYGMLWWRYWISVIEYFIRAVRVYGCV